MSGLAALLDLRGSWPVRERLGCMLPDADVTTGTDAALGCSRAADFGVARGDALVVVADARLYNRQALARELAVPPGALLSDSALILRAYLRWQEACAAHLIGDFAFVIYDAVRRRMLCARDHTGKRVLFYHSAPERFAAASSARALLRLPEIPARLNEEKIAEFLVLVQQPDSTFYTGIHRLPPAHVLTVDARGTRLHRYWAPDPDQRIRLKSDDDYVQGFRDVFGTAVRSRLEASDETGVLVSGGLDSPTVTAVAATSLREQNRVLHAFHAAPPVGYQGTTYANWIIDESDDVKAIAELHPNVRLHVVRPDGRSLLDGVDDYFMAAGAPMLNPVNRPWFEQLYELAQASGVYSLMTGQRGNATFSYNGSAALREYFVKLRWLTLRDEVRALAAARGQTARSVLRYRVLEPALPQWVLALERKLRGDAAAPQKLPREQMASAINPAFAQELHIDDRVRAAGLDTRSVRSADGRTARIRLLTATGDGADVMHGFRMRYGIAPLDPTADIRVIDYCLAIPEAQYLRGGRDRYLVRRAMVDMLPERVLNRTTRGAQAADWPQQLTRIRPEIARELQRLREVPVAARCLDLDRMQQLVDNWPEQLGIKHHYDYGLLLLRGIMMGRFIRWFEAQDWRGAQPLVLQPAGVVGTAS